MLITAALVLLTPRGTSPATAPYIGLVAAAILSLAAGMAPSGWLMRNSLGLYAGWLERL